MSYDSFLKSKVSQAEVVGFEVDDSSINSMLFPFQRDIVKWALRCGKVAVFADCGLGKTPIQLEWARQIHDRTGKNILIFAPLAVSAQTQREGEKFGIPVTICKTSEDISHGINVTNYERLHHFDPSDFVGIILDESSILKSYTGKYRNELVERWALPYRLCCTATPAPNDYMELGNHSEFLGIKTRMEMLAEFFVHDSMRTSSWRLKGHAQNKFWQWLCSWAVMLQKPSDLGYDDDGFILPELRIHNEVIKIDETKSAGEWLFRLPASTLQERQEERRLTVEERVQHCADLINGSTDSWLIWCNFNYESTALAKQIKNAVEVRGSDSVTHKEQSLLGFSRGNVQRLVTKPTIAGFGMNWQHCHNVAFVGLSDSYEQFYQAVRRCWRFGQTDPVDCYIITASTEGAVTDNIRRKEQEAQRMAREMVKHMHVYNEGNIRGQYHETTPYVVAGKNGRHWKMQKGDSCELIDTVETDTVGFSIFSPPFASLYTYSDSERDMGNSRSDDEFWEHFGFLIPEILRVTRPGRLCSVHCMNLPTVKEREGYIGLRDFRGDIIRYFQEAGWIYHSEVCIWKDPLLAAVRTKALGLLYKQLQKDSAMVRQGLADYVLTFRKHGENQDPIRQSDATLHSFIGEDPPTKKGVEQSHQIWRRYASPIWSDIRQTNTLNVAAARDERDERHICPLQLDVIERCLLLWSNPGDLVFSPFAGIGSEGYVALKMKRRFLGFELKSSYYEQALLNLQAAESQFGDLELFADSTDE